MGKPVNNELDESVNQPTIQPYLFVSGDVMGKKGKRKKIGRNDPCPCGSGKKFKFCHAVTALSGGKSKLDKNLRAAIEQKIKEQEALDFQRKKQQGLGKPIISAAHKGNRFIAVGKELHWSPKWKTFHDFLGDYLKLCFGKDWWFEELAKNSEEKHYLLLWSELAAKYTKEIYKTEGGVSCAPMTGALEALYGLSYYLYLMAHNVELQTKLVDRLKNVDQFFGAYYETFVAAAFIKAGFDIALEDENDISTSHCEFTATFRKTGKKYSVEAKCRQGAHPSPRVGNQLYRALRKQANHERVVFVELNVPDKATDEEIMNYVQDLSGDLRELESRLKINNNPAPPAYVFLTNFPYQHALQSTNIRCFSLAEGFKIPEFNSGLLNPNIREALKTREKHNEMYQLAKSFQEYSGIPSTFDGEIPELAYGKTEARLVIGGKYLVPDGSGKDVAGELVEAIVAWDKALGVYKLEDGRSIMVTCPLTDDELAAYKKHPDTFFGVYKEQGRKAETPLELFDFFYDVYKKTDKEKLLEFMKDNTDFEDLKNYPQNELAMIYCERLVYSTYRPRK